jgi:hypothetical protein
LGARINGLGSNWVEVGETLISLLFFYTKGKQKNGVLFGNLERSEELLAILEEKSGKTTIMG